MANTTQLTNKEIIELTGLEPSVIQDLQSKESETFKTASNQVLSALVNKIVYQTIDSLGWENPFRKFDGFTIDFGENIENIFIDTPQGYNFNPDATNPFDKAPNVAHTLYATINYKRQYQATIQDVLLRQAVLNQYGLMNIVNTILKQLTVAMNVEEYYYQISALNNPEIYGNSTGETGAKVFETLDLSTLATNQEKFASLTNKIVDVATSFELPSTKHNALGIRTVSNKGDVLLIIRRDLLNSINLDYLAGIYNLTKVELISRIMTIESFQVEQTDPTTGTTTLFGEDLGFVVLDTKGFDNHVALADGGMIYNPRGLYTNHFMNLWKVIAFKYFYNAEAYIVKL